MKGLYTIQYKNNQSIVVKSNKKKKKKKKKNLSYSDETIVTLYEFILERKYLVNFSSKVWSYKLNRPVTFIITS